MGLISEKRRVGFSGRASRGSRRRGLYTALAVLGGLVLLVAVAVVVVLRSADATLGAGSSALAKVGMPLDGGKITSVAVIGGPRDEAIPIELRRDQIWPRVRIPAGERVTIAVVVRRKGWDAWLTGRTQRLRLTLVTPAAQVAQQYITLPSGAPLRLQFDQAVAAVSYGPELGQLTRHTLGGPSTSLTLARTAPAGTIWVAAMARTWENAKPTVVSWFPAGARTAAVADPQPGTRIGSSTSIVLTFSKTVAQALGSSLPPVSPANSGSWHQVSSHTIVFRPSGYGYGLGATVRIGLPAGVALIGGRHSGAAESGTWSVPPGSTVRLQELLSALGYLPFNFQYAHGGVPLNPLAQESAAINPPKGTFAWAYGNVPSLLRGIWQPGASGEMTKGAVMAFENNEGMTTDGIAGPQVWNALIGAVIHNQKSTFGYTFVQVNEGSPETESTWHSGKTVVSGLVNTGIPAAPTAQGLFAVFEHALSVTMSGYNPDGTYYSDPGIPFVSYFNTGDALHYFPRGGYGYPQSLGCVEMPYGEAEAVYPYTPIGTLVDVT